MFADSHIHLSHRIFNKARLCLNPYEKDNYSVLDRLELVNEFIKHDIGICILPGIDVESSRDNLTLSMEFSGVAYPAVGIRPPEVKNHTVLDLLEIVRLSQENAVVAIGEIGLDYHRSPTKREKRKQKRWFAWQLQLACRRHLPVLLHIREADDDATKILRRYRKALHGGIYHCYKGNAAQAEFYFIELGLMAGVGDVVLKNTDEELARAIRSIPMERIVLETDAPYFPNGKPNDKPGFASGKMWKSVCNSSLVIPSIALKISKIKGISPSEVEAATTNNVASLFGINVIPKM